MVMHSKCKNAALDAQQVVDSSTDLAELYKKAACEPPPELQFAAAAMDASSAPAISTVASFADAAGAAEPSPTLLIMISFVIGFLFVHTAAHFFRFLDTPTC